LGLPILPDLLRCRALAVADYNGAPCALQLQQTRQSLNLGYPIENKKSSPIWGIGWFFIE
jgi:hypothetical protein